MSPLSATATPPVLSALVDRLLGPLARATDDAMRRLDLVIETDGADDGAPTAEAVWHTHVVEAEPTVLPPQVLGMPHQDHGAGKLMQGQGRAESRAPQSPAESSRARGGTGGGSTTGAVAASTSPSGEVEPQPSSAPVRVEGHPAWGQGVPPATSLVTGATGGSSMYHPGQAIEPAQAAGLRVVAAEPAEILPVSGPLSDASPEAWSSHVQAPEAAAPQAALPGAASITPAPGVSVAMGASPPHRATAVRVDLPPANAASVEVSAAPVFAARAARGGSHAPLLAAAAAVTPVTRAVPAAGPHVEETSAFGPASAASPDSVSASRATRLRGLRVGAGGLSVAAVGEAAAVPAGADRRRPGVSAAMTPEHAGDAAAEPQGLPGTAWGAATPRPLRLVANRLDRVMAPVFSRALDAAPLQDGDGDDAAAGAPARISNTFNVKVALGGAAGALDARQVEEALGDWLRASARRQGLLP